MPLSALTKLKIGGSRVEQFIGPMENESRISILGFHFSILCYSYAYQMEYQVLQGTNKQGTVEGIMRKENVIYKKGEVHYKTDANFKT